MTFVSKDNLEEKMVYLITEYGALLKSQVKAYLGLEEETIKRIIKNLSKKGRIVYEAKNDVIKAGNEIKEDRNLITCFWIVQDFKNDLTFHYVGNYPLMIIVYAKDAVYEVFYCPKDEELTMSHAINQIRTTVGAKTLIVVEEKYQMPLINVPNAVFCMINDEGKVLYYE